MAEHTPVDLQRELAQDLINERKRDRLWKNLRFFIGLLVFLTLISLSFCSRSPNTESLSDEKNGYVAFIRLDGLIAPGKDFSAETLMPELKSAFSDTKAKGVILDINSGGGTPVQASIIHDEILRLKKKYHKKVVVVAEDMLASGAYFVAVSADKIYVNPNTVTGSIGVIMQGFGLQDAIKKLGIDRRVITSGEHKDRLDPFLPENPDDVAKLKSVIAEVHQNFNQAVLEGRKGKLHGDLNELFSGDFWTGTTALKLGLVDHLGNLPDAMLQEFNVYKYRDYTDTNDFFKKLTGSLGSVLHLPLDYTHEGLMEKI